MKRAALLAFGFLFVGALAMPGTARADMAKPHVKVQQVKTEPKKTNPAPTTATPPPPAATPVKGEMAHATLKDATGKAIGEATLEETPHGVIVNLELTGATPGSHAFHIHAVGKCDAATGFKGAGGHFNPGGHKHGIKAVEGKHAGDMPNIDVPESGKLKFEIFNSDVTLKAGEKNSLFHPEGTALVMHKGTDDMVTDPTGNAGDRQACGVIEKVAPQK